MKPTGNYREGIERFVPSASEAFILLGIILFTWPIRGFNGQALFGGNDNDAIAGLSTFLVVAMAWVVGVALRSAMNDMRWWLVTGGIVALLIPWLSLNTFQMSLMTQTAYFAILILGLNIVTGLTGQVSLGHGALVGVAAYATAILVTHWGWQLFPAMLVAIALTTALGFGLGIPALRLAGPYLAIATLAAAIIFPLVMKLDSLHDYTGTVQGLRLEKQPSPPGPIGAFLEDRAHIPENKKFATETVKQNERVKWAGAAWLYYLTIVPAVIAMYGAWNLTRGRIGRAFVAVRDAEVAATSMGINVALYKVLAFGISAFYAGVTGSLLFMVIAFVSPESFDLVNLSIMPLAYLVIGGLAATGGPIIGAIGIKWVPEITSRIARAEPDFDLLQGALIGIMLIVIMTRMPQGIWGAAVALNRQPWAQLRTRTDAWFKEQSVLTWAGLALAVAAIIVASLWFGAFWGVLVAGVLLVAPRGVWAGIAAPLRRLNLPGMRGRHETPQPDVT